MFRGFRLTQLLRKRSSKQLIGIAFTAITAIEYYRNETKSNCEPVEFSSSSHSLIKGANSSANELSVAYKYDSVGSWTYVKKAFQYGIRICEYIIYGLPLAVLAPVAYWLRDRSPEAEDLVWQYFIWTIEQLGPTFIKFAQWASTRPDLYPPALISKLLVLQDNVPVRHSTRTVEMTLKEAFGEDWHDEIELDSHPIGAGCIAQVFRGVLKRDKFGRSLRTPVAVKLIHPHVERLVQTDMELLTIIASMLDSVPALELLSFGDTCRQFADMMREQLDLRIEGRNLVKFARKWADERWASFPRPIEGFVTKTVLVETLMEGAPLSEFCKLKDDASEGASTLRRKLSDLGCRAVLKMIFFDNFVHGDLHPGNILVQLDERGNPRFVFLDCGIVFSSKTEQEHQMLVDICYAFMRHDGVRAGQLMMDRNPARYAHLSESERARNKEAFCRGLQKMIDDSEQELFFDHFNSYVSRICDLARDFSIKLDPTYFQVAMALKIMEGVSLSLNKELNMITKCVPIVARAQALKKLGMLKFPSPDEDEQEQQQFE